MRNGLNRRTKSRVRCADEKSAKASQTFFDYELNEIAAEIRDEDIGQFRFDFDPATETEKDPDPPRTIPFNGREYGPYCRSAVCLTTVLP